MWFIPRCPYKYVAFRIVSYHVMDHALGHVIALSAPLATTSGPISGDNREVISTTGSFGKKADSNYLSWPRRQTTKVQDDYWSETVNYQLFVCLMGLVGGGGGWCWRYHFLGDVSGTCWWSDKTSIAVFTITTRKYHCARYCASFETRLPAVFARARARVCVLFYI